MSQQLQKKFISLISGHLELFSWRRDLANFRCPYCDDSKKKKNKKRAFLYINKDGLYNFVCHNGCPGRNFDNFFKDLFPHFYDYYRQEKIQKRETIQSSFKQVEAKEIVEPIKPDVLAVEGLQSLFDMPDGHIAIEYVKQRRIPVTSWKQIYWTDTFGDVVRAVSGKADEYKKIKNEPRLVLPLKSRTELFGLVGRTLNPDSELRYITVKFGTDNLKLYGLDRYEHSKPGFIVEGPIDSMFLPNCLAMAGSDVDVIEIRKIVNLNTVVVLDNEPRNKAVIAKMEKFATGGFRVCVWSGISEDFKDVNDLAIAGWDAHKLQLFINNHAYSGLRLRAELARWRKM